MKESIWRNAWRLTLEFFEWSPRLLVYPILIFIGFLVHLQWAKSSDQPLEEVILWLNYTIVPSMLFSVLLLVFNFAAAPFRTQRDARLRAEGELAEMSSQIVSMRSELEDKRSPKGKIRAALEAINPGILRAIDSGNNKIYIIATETKFNRLIEECDNVYGRQLVEKIEIRGQDSGNNNIIGSGEPYRDSIEFGMKFHFTIFVREAIKV